MQHWIIHGCFEIYPTGDEWSLESLEIYVVDDPTVNSHGGRLIHPLCERYDPCP